MALSRMASQKSLLGYPVTLSGLRFFTIFVIALLLETEIGRIAGLRTELILSLGLGLAFLIMYAMSSNLKLVVTPIPLTLVLYVSFIVLSSLWSVSPLKSFLHACTFIFFLIILLVGPRIEKHTLVKWSIFGMLAVCILSWLLYILAGDVALSSKEVAWRLKGILGHEQRLSLFCGIGLILTFRFRTLFSKKFILVSVLIITATLMATQARAFIAFTFTTLAFMYLIESKKSQKMIAFFLVLLVSIIFYVGMESVATKFSRGANDQTLTGRTTIWVQTLHRAEERPILGFGFASFLEEGVSKQIFQSYEPPHAHNTFIHSLFETGYLGTAFLVIWMIFIACSKNSSRVPLYLMFFSVLCGLMGIVFGAKMNGVLFFTLFIIIIYSRTDKDYLGDK
jgi:exopolysaccharide production protein ExoQ